LRNFEELKMGAKGIFAGKRKIIKLKTNTKEEYRGTKKQKVRKYY